MSSDIFSDGSGVWSIKLKAGTRMYPVTVTQEGKRLFLSFGYNPKLLEEVKAMQGAKWHGHDETSPRKAWSIADSQRNRFQLKALAYPGNNPLNPYSRYDAALPDFMPARMCAYLHQREMGAFGLQRRQCIFAVDMGAGKTLAAIEIIEQSNFYDWIYVAPKSALVSVKLEFIKWNARVTPRFVTYEGLKKLLAEWPEHARAPQGVIFDECSRCKNPTAQRTQAAMYLADQIRAEWGDKGFIILMSGTPAPKSPADWWSICEIACPGFLREGDINKFKKRLAIIEQRESFAGGGGYPHLVTWRDDEKKCDVCGLFEDAETHSGAVDVFNPTVLNHVYVPGKNEVALLHERMRGLVMVKFKKDILDLPDKIYREILCRPTQSILNAARSIQAKANSTIQALVGLRELSDGFQYTEQKTGQTKPCELCKGNLQIEEKVCVDATIQDMERGCYEDGTPLTYTTQLVECGRCGGTGLEDRTERKAVQVACPKEQALKDLLDEYDDIGRVVVYGGFTGTIDRITSIVKDAGWNYIRVDGRGWHSSIPGVMGPLKPQDMMMTFQNDKEKYARVAFIGQPGAAGMGLTLTASPVIIYYSNDFNAESREQSENRIHRAGMDTNRGATIIDLIHLPSDRLVLTNLKQKRRLQDMTMGQMNLHLSTEESRLLRDTDVVI